MKDKEEQSYALTEKKENFSEWYNQIVKVAGLLDQRYPVKGCEVLMPFGTELLDTITEKLEHMLKENGNKKVLFPLFIPESFLKKESDHIKGFEGEVFHVTHAGNNKLMENLILRPTSETAMYPMFSLWIRSHKDLPLKIFQTVSVFRYETKMTKPLIRMREIMFFNESHTAHKDWEDAENEIKNAMNIYSKHFTNNLAIPFIINKRPITDTFPGAIYTKAFDTIMPDGKSMQIGTVHNLGDNFSKAFDIKYIDESEEKKNVIQTCYGISTRALAAVVAIHGDDKGLVLPPEIAPIQIVIIPVVFQKQKDQIMHEAQTLYEKLKKHFRVHLDIRDQAIGSKFYDWEIKGIPLRIVIGPKEIENNALSITKRFDNEKLTIGEKNIEEFIRNLLDNIQHDMLVKAQEYHKNKIIHVSDKEEAKQVAENKKFAAISWCGSIECAQHIEEDTELALIGYDDKKPSNKCIHCGKDAKHKAYLGKKY
ncbi:MAG: proline--tRNA ligase [Candidatus Aenigmatarchaeota archaeon]